MNENIPAHPIRIGIDANEANTSHRVGSNVYAFELIKQLEEQTRNHSHISFIIFLTEHPVADMPPARDGWKYQLLASKKFATQWSLPLTLFKMRKQLDLFYTPGHYAPRFCPVPYVTSVMDLGYLHFPQQFKVRDYWQLKLWTKYSVQKAKHTVAISEYTKHDVVKHYHVKPENVSVIYPAMNVLAFRRENQNLRQEAFHRFGINSPYILYVGTIQPRKNLIRLIEAFEHLQLKYQSELNKAESTKKKKKKKEPTEKVTKNIQLVLAGKPGWLSDPILKRIEESPFVSQIVLTGYVTEEEKAVLYYHAMCTVLVGLLEGFGMPALESLFYKVVPVVSNISSLPEVVGDAGILVDPYNDHSILKGIDQALSLNQKERKEFERRATKQVEHFSWQKSGEQLLQLLISQASPHS